MGEMQTHNLRIDVDIADPATGESFLETGAAGDMECLYKHACNLLGRYTRLHILSGPNMDEWVQHDWI